ncbi:hypothetical protein HZB07_02860 [Candidatus Saganbacteria bacterium]|nr:hypothetical protein [Candidatus Saganbacteria bacterium]
MTLKQTMHLIEIASFYKNFEEIGWALRFNFDDNYVSKYEKVKAPFTKEKVLNEQSHNPDDQLYLSPSGQYRVEYFPSNEGSGFYIINNNTNNVQLTMKHWVINPTIIKWAFNEKYIIFEYRYSDEDMVKTLVTNIHTRKSIFL